MKHPLQDGKNTTEVLKHNPENGKSDVYDPFLVISTEFTPLLQLLMNNQ